MEEDSISDEDMNLIQPILKKLNDDCFALIGKRLYARFIYYEDLGPNHPHTEMRADLPIEQADIRIEHEVVSY